VIYVPKTSGGFPEVGGEVGGGGGVGLRGGAGGSGGEERFEKIATTMIARTTRRTTIPKPGPLAAARSRLMIIFCIYFGLMAGRDSNESFGRKILAEFPVRIS
jgi:hypothetical protein